MLLTRLLPRSLAVVGIVGALTFSMPIAASADAWDYALFELIASGAGAVAGEGVVAAAPEVVAGSGFACAAALPVCAAVGAAVVGGALYLTKDTWLPWFTGGATVGGGSGTAGTGLIMVFTPGTTPYGAGDPMVFDMDSTGGAAFIDALSWTGVLRNGDGSTGPFSGYHGSFWVQPSGAGSSWHDWVAFTPLPDQTIVSVTAQDEYGTSITFGEAAVAPTVASLEVSCTNPDGSQYAVTSSVPSADGLVQMPTCTGKAGDLGGAKAKCVTLSAGNGTGAMTVQSSDCVAAGIASTLYPECAASGCRYVVYVDGAPCTVGRTGCTDWSRTYANSPGRVGCRYGEHWVSADHCFFLERVYEATGAPVQATLGNTDGNPETFTGPTPAPNPQPQPQPQPIPDGAPGGAPGALPGGATGALPSPSGVPLTNGDCFGGGAFSWNPVSWVVTPIKCALAWAFVPSPAFLANWSGGVSTAWATTPFGQWSASVPALVPAITGTGCAGPSLSTGFMSGLPGHPLPAQIHPFDACSAPMSTVAATSYMILSAGIAFYGGMKVVRQLGYAFGFQIHAGSERSTFT